MILFQVDVALDEFVDFGGHIRDAQRGFGIGRQLLGHHAKLVYKVWNDEPAQAGNQCDDDNERQHDGDAAGLDAGLALQPLDERLDDIGQDEAHDKGHEHRAQVIDEPHAHGHAGQGQHHPNHAVKVIFLLYGCLCHCLWMS